MLISQLHSLITEAKDTSRGTYAAVKYSQETLDKIQSFCDKYKVPNSIHPSDIHTTLLYSRKHCPKFEAMGDLNYVATATPKKLEIWTDHKQKKILVIKLESESLVNRHERLMSEHKATYDYDEYIPHITLSYNIGSDFDTDSILKADLEKELGEFTIVHEYGEELNLDK